MEHKVQELSSLATWLSVQLPDAETNPQLATLLEATDNLRDEWDTIVRTQNSGYSSNFIHFMISRTSKSVP